MSLHATGLLNGIYYTFHGDFLLMDVSFGHEGEHGQTFSDPSSFSTFCHRSR